MTILNRDDLESIEPTSDDSRCWGCGALLLRSYAYTIHLLNMCHKCSAELEDDSAWNID